MKYSKTALGLLNAQYRSVLRKCFLINAGLFALGAVAATPANADSTVTTATELVDAVKAADTAGNTTTTITLGEAISDGDGLFLTQNKNNDITLNLNSKSLNIDGPAVGSTGTENQGIHAEKNNKLTIEDGNISFNGSSDIKMGIQNYSDLTLDSVNIDGNGVSGKYVLSNNNGTTTIKNSTITAKVGGVAFDVCDATGVGYSGTTVNLIDSTIQGAIELANWGTPVGQSTENAVLNASGDNEVTGDINNELGSVNLKDGTLTLDGSITGNGELNIDSAATLAMKGADAVISQKSVENNGKINVLEGKTTLKSTVTGTGTMSAAEGAVLDTSQADIEQSEIDLKGATVQNNMFSAIGNLKADTYVVDAATTTNLTALGTDGEYNVLSANGAKDVVLGDTGTKVYLGTNAEGNEIATQKYVADNAVQSVVTGETNGTIKVDGTEVAVAGLGTMAYEDKTNYSTTSEMNSAISTAVSTKANAADVYTKNETDTLLSGKQDNLSSTQMNAVNSGITAAMVSSYNSVVSAVNDADTGLAAVNTALAGKQDSLSSTQMNAVNSGITAAKVSDYDSLKSSVDDATTGLAATNTLAANTAAAVNNSTSGLAATKAIADAAKSTADQNKEDIEAINASDVMNSGITSDKVSTYDGYAAQINAKANAADVYTKDEVNTALAGKQDTIADLADIRSGAEAGATALQATDIKTGTTNGTISVDGADVAVYGLGSAAYTSADAYDVKGAAAAVQGNTAETVASVDTKVTNLANNVYSKADTDAHITTAIQALDAEASQTAGNDGLALNITEVDGKITSISGSIAEGTYDKAGAAAAVQGNTTKTVADNEAEIARVNGELVNTNAALNQTNTNLSNLNGAVEAEIARAKAAEQANANAISAEETRAKAAEQANANAITAEETRAKAAEQANANAITAEETRAKAAEQANANAITAEETRAKAAEQANANAITAEETRAKAAEQANANAITAEETRAKAAEQAIDAKFTNGEVDAKFASVETTGDVTVGKNLNIKGNLDIDGAIDVDGDVNIGEKFSVKASDGSFSAAGGAFTVNKNGRISVNNGGEEVFFVNKNGNIETAGTLSVADGAFDVDEDGAIYAANGAFEVNKNGRISVYGDDGEEVFFVNKNGKLSAAGDKFVVDPNGNINKVGDITSSGKVTAANGFEVDASNSLTADGLKASAANIAGNADIDGNLTVDGISHLDGGIYVSDRFGVDADGNIGTEGTLLAKGLASLNGGINVNDLFTVDKDTGDTGVGGDLTVSGGAAIDKDLSVGNNANIGGDLNVAGTSNLKDTNVDGDLDVTGEVKGGTFTNADGSFTVDENGKITANAVTSQKNLIVIGKNGTEDDPVFKVNNLGAIDAAGGAFHVNNLGAVTAADGKFKVNSLGAITAADGKFHVNSEGDINTVRNITASGTMTADGESKFVKDGDKYVLDVTSDAVTANKVIEAKEGVKFGADTIAMTSVTRDAIASKPADGSDAVIASATAVQKTRAAIEADNAAVLGGIYKIDETNKTVSYDNEALLDEENPNGFEEGATNLTEALTNYAANVQDAMGTEYAADGTFANKYADAHDGVAYYGLANDDDLVSAIAQIEENIGAGDGLGTIAARTEVAANNGVASTNTVNGNIKALNETIGDLNGLNPELKNLTNGTDEAPKTVVEAFNNIDATLGKIHGLYADGTVNTTRVESTVNGHSNLASGTTVEDHLVSLDNAIGDRTLASKNAAINEAMSGTSVAAGLKAAGDAIGDMNFGQSHFVGGTNDLSGAVRALDDNLYRVETDLHDLKRDFNRGMASMAAMSALVPNPRAHGNTSLAIGTGAYSGHTAMAIGGFHYLTDNIMLNAGVAWGNSRDASYRMGVTFSW